MFASLAAYLRAARSGVSASRRSGALPGSGLVLGYHRQTGCGPVARIAYIGGAAACGLLLGALLQGASPSPAALIVASALLVSVTAALLAELVASRSSAARFRSLVEHSSDVIAVVGVDTMFHSVSPAAERVLGYTPAELIGRRLLELSHPEDADRIRTVLASAGKRPGPTPAAEWRLRRNEQGWRHVSVIATDLLADRSVAGIVLTLRDVTEQRVLEEQLAHETFHDSLTGLANRSLFRDRVGHGLVRRARSGSAMAVLSIDIDDFERVNECCGHADGDRVLMGVAERLRLSVRASDTVARLGGDEFAVLLEDAGDGHDAQKVAARIGEALRQPFSLSGREVFVTCSLGIAGADPGVAVEDLLRQADVAMYMAKSVGKNSTRVFEPAMHTELLERLDREADLRRAQERQEFVLHFQPIVALGTRRISGVEALVRWQHPKRGLVSPAAFIPLAEETGLIVPLGRWVLGEACRQASRWQREYPRRGPVMLMVNLSGRQLRDDALVDDVRAALRVSGLPAASLVLEVSEGVLMENTRVAFARLQALKELGVRLAIDDFGTGSSSLDYLRRFPVDILKIDKTFIDGVGAGAAESPLAHAIITLGQALRLSTVAEGIETEAQASELARIGCELAQGHLFSRPVTVDVLDGLLADGLRSIGPAAPSGKATPG